MSDIKIRVTMTKEFVISNERAKEDYGTTDPEECAKIDQQNFDDDPGLFLHSDGDVNVKVEGFYHGI